MSKSELDREFELEGGRKVTGHQILDIARHVVTSWEGIPAMVDDFFTRFPYNGSGTEEEARQIHERHLRECVGGEEFYRASKALIEDLEQS